MGQDKMNNGINNVATDKEVQQRHGIASAREHEKYHISREATAHFKPRQQKGLTNS